MAASDMSAAALESGASSEEILSVRHCERHSEQNVSTLLRRVEELRQKYDEHIALAQRHVVAAQEDRDEAKRELNETLDEHIQIESKVAKLGASRNKYIHQLEKLSHHFSPQVPVKEWKREDTDLADAIVNCDKAKEAELASLRAELEQKRQWFCEEESKRAALDDKVDELEQALSTAIAQEREACIETVKSLGHPEIVKWSEAIAAAIRRREEGRD